MLKPKAGCASFVHFSSRLLIFLFLLVGPEVHMLKHFEHDTITVKKGEPIDMPADVLGLPIPTVEWSKDDIVIPQSTETVLIHTEVTGRLNCKTSLTIPSAKRADRGTYVVAASNNTGTARHTIYVMVLGEFQDQTINGAVHICTSCN